MPAYLIYSMSCQVLKLLAVFPKRASSMKLEAASQHLKAGIDLWSFTQVTYGYLNYIFQAETMPSAGNNSVGRWELALLKAIQEDHTEVARTGRGMAWEDKSDSPNKQDRSGT